MKDWRFWVLIGIAIPGLLIDGIQAGPWHPVVNAAWTLLAIGWIGVICYIAGQEDQSKRRG